MEGVDSEGEQDFNDSFNILFLEMLFELSLMLFNDIFTDEFSALDPALVDDDFVVFAELYFIVFDGLVERLVLVAALLDVVDYLEEVDGDGEDLPPCL